MEDFGWRQNRHRPRWKGISRGYAPVTSPDHRWIQAKADKNLEHLQPHLESGETVEAFVEGHYETKIMGSESVRKGILAATDRRVLFFAKKMGGYDLESFPYGNISSLEQGKGMTGGTLKFFATGNNVFIKYIDVRKHNLGDFMTLVQEHMNAAKSGSATLPAPEADLVDQIRNLADLRDSGILSDEEFQTAKTDLLRRL